ncbi:MAG: FAD-binding domain-containing protein [Aquiluna sp.]
MREIAISEDIQQTIESEFSGLYSGELGLSSIRGGQTAANVALQSLDISGYAANRSEVLPRSARGATVLSPYIRHNLITLTEAYDRVSKAPYKDREKFRDELYWQEYARHLYARVGTELFQNLRFEAEWKSEGDGWNRDMACVDHVVSELETDGWLVNQTRMWLASHWTVRNGQGWLSGQERMHRELIDGSRAANLLGWQWTVGAGTGKPYGFARWQVEKRAPGLCSGCQLRNACPIQEFPQETFPRQLEANPLLNRDPDPRGSAGPLTPVELRKPEVVLLTIDSLGDGDPAMTANPDLPVAFVFNEPALKKLQLSSRRIGFYLETLADLSRRRDLKVYIGDPVEFTEANDVAVTYAPVPSFRKFRKLAQVHPYPWLAIPQAGTVRSFTAWRKGLGR